MILGTRWSCNKLSRLPLVGFTFRPYSKGEKRIRRNEGAKKHRGDKTGKDAGVVRVLTFEEKKDGVKYNEREDSQVGTPRGVLSTLTALWTMLEVRETRRTRRRRPGRTKGANGGWLGVRWRAQQGGGRRERDGSRCGIYAATSETHFVHQSGYTDDGERRRERASRKGRGERAGGAKVTGARAGQTFYRCSEQDGRTGWRAAGRGGGGASERRCRAGERQRRTPGIRWSRWRGAGGSWVAAEYGSDRGNQSRFEYRRECT